MTRGEPCLDAIAPDDRLVAHHCHEGRITLLDPQTGEIAAIGLPGEIPADACLGGGRFSPDGARVAFSATTGGFGVGGAADGRGFVLVSDDHRGGTHVVAESAPGEWFSVVAWLWDDRLILQPHSADPAVWPAVWSVRTDGSELTKLADGVFLGQS